MNKYLVLGLLLLLVGCSSKEKGSVSAEQLNPSPTSSLPSDNSTTPPLNPNVLPDISKKEKLGEVDATNDLIDSFYYDGNGVKVSLTVAADRACFVYVRRTTPDKAGELEIESLQREKLGLWRSYKTQRLFTQPTGSQLNIYSSDEELSSTYQNPAISSDALQADKDFKERQKSFNLLLRQDLSASDSAKRVYASQCQKLRNFYYKEELPLLRVKERQEFERSVEKSTQN